MQERTYKKLNGIKPFNDFLFRSCYYHQLMAAYSRYGNEKIWLMNHLPVYSLDKDGITISVEEVDIYGEREIENITGIRQIKKATSKDIIREIIKSIDYGMPIILAVDCYHLSYREDTYKKRHIIHFMLIYGYDKVKKKLIANEPKHHNDAIYHETETDFSDVRNAFESYQKKLYKNQKAGIIKIKKIANKKILPDVGRYKNAVLQNRNKIEQGFYDLQKFFNSVLSLLENKDELMLLAQKIIDCLSHLRETKLLQKFQTVLIYGTDELNDTFEKITENAMFMSMLLMKIKVMNFLNEKSAEKIKQRISDTTELERKVHSFYLGKSI